MPEQTLQSIAFPTLSDAQIREFEAGTGAISRSFGTARSSSRSATGTSSSSSSSPGRSRSSIIPANEPKTVTIHRKGEFTGDVSHLTGRASIISAVARGQCEASEVSGDALRAALNQCPTLSDIILQAFIARRQLLRESGDFMGLRVIGSRYSTDTFRVRDFLAKNRALFTWLDVETHPEVGQLLQQFGLTEADTPVVALGDLLLLRNPSNRELADAIGIHQPLEQTVYDLVVVGAGPAGLAAAVYGASEGLHTVLLERTAPGGQAGASMRIENYLGFPTGVTGSELAERAMLQANKFGARLSVPSQVTGLTLGERLLRPASGRRRDGHHEVPAHRHGRRLPPLGRRGVRALRGQGRLLRGHARRGADLPRGAGRARGRRQLGRAKPRSSSPSMRAGWSCLIRGDSLYKSMSSYLARRIEHTRNIKLHVNTTIRRMRGDGHLDGVEVLHESTGQARMVDTPAVFSFIGAVPRTEWLPPEIERDAKGFIRTGADVAQSPHWRSRRPPFLLETSRPGVFAAGDVRSGSAKRVASAVGEGSMVVQFVHEVLETL